MILFSRKQCPMPLDKKFLYLWFLITCILIIYSIWIIYSIFIKGHLWQLNKDPNFLIKDHLCTSSKDHDILLQIFNQGLHYLVKDQIIHSIQGRNFSNKDLSVNSKDLNINNRGRNWTAPQVWSGKNLRKGLIIVGAILIAPLPFWVTSEIDNWNFQHMLLFWFREASQS